MANGSQNVISIKLQVTGAQSVSAHFQRGQEALRRFNAEAAKGSEIFGKLTQVAALAFSAVTLGRWAKAAEESAVATAQLTQALRTSGQAAEVTTGELISQANALQLLTGVSDEAVQAVQRVLLTTGATGKEVKDLTPLVLDLAAAMETDAVTAAKQLGRVLDGETIKLERYNISAGNVTELMQQLQLRVGGQAAAVFQAKGAWAELGVTFGELEEEFGRFIRVLTGDAVKGFSDGIRQLTERLAAFREQHPALLNFVSTLAGNVGQLAGRNLDLIAGALAAVVAVKGLNLGLAAFTSLQAFLALLGGGRILNIFVQAQALFDTLRGNWVQNLTIMLGAGTRLLTMLSLLASGVTVLVTAWAGFQVGGFIAQTKVLGVAIDEWLAHSILRATYAFEAFFGFITEEEYRTKLGALQAQLAALRAEAEKVPEALNGAAAPVPVQREMSARLQVREDPAFNIANQQRLIDIEMARVAMLGSTVARYQEINPLITRQIGLANEQADLTAKAYAMAQEDFDLWMKSAAMRADNEANRNRRLALANDLEKARQAYLSGEITRQAELLRLERERFKANEDLLAATYAGSTQQQFDQFNDSRATEQATGTGGLSAGAVAGIQEALMQIGTLAQQVGRAMSTFIGGAINGISDGIKGLIKGTQTWGQALANIGGAIMDGIIDAIARMFAEWIVGMILKSAVTRSTAAVDAAAKAPVALLDSISSFGIAAAIGGAAFLAAMALAGGFAGGGYTGDGGASEPAGMVHGREFVFSSPATARIGREDLESLHRGEASVQRNGSGSSVNLATFDSRLDAQKWAESAESETWFVDMASKTLNRWRRS